MKTRVLLLTAALSAMMIMGCKKDRDQPSPLGAPASTQQKSQTLGNSAREGEDALDHLSVEGGRYPFGQLRMDGRAYDIP